MESKKNKTIYIEVKRKTTPAHINYSIRSMPLKIVQEFKYLDVLFKSNLNWNSHVENVCTKASHKMWKLGQKFAFATPEKTAYISLILPTLEYPSPVSKPFTHKKKKNKKTSMDWEAFKVKRCVSFLITTYLRSPFSN